MLDSCSALIGNWGHPWANLLAPLVFSKCPPQGLVPANGLHTPFPPSASVSFLRLRLSYLLASGGAGLGQAVIPLSAGSGSEPGVCVPACQCVTEVRWPAQLCHVTVFTRDRCEHLPLARPTKGFSLKLRCSLPT